jgi:hypothetical protein
LLLHTLYTSCKLSYLLPMLAVVLQHEEYSVTPHKHDVVCKKYEHGGGPIRTAAAAAGVPVGMLGKQVCVCGGGVPCCAMYLGVVLG